MLYITSGRIMNKHILENEETGYGILLLGKIRVLFYDTFICSEIKWVQEFLGFFLVSHIDNDLGVF